MKFAAYKTSRLAFENAGAAVSQRGCNCGGFTLLELMVVIILIGILSMLAYSSFTDIIFTSRAKETAQTMRTFAEKALMDAKRQSIEVKISIPQGSNAIIAADAADKEIAREAFSQGFSASSSGGTPVASAAKNFNNGVMSQIRIGLSGITEAGHFAACDSRSYCAAAIKTKDNNSFQAYVKRGNSAQWEAL